MLTATAHVRQVVTDWQITVVITEHYGQGIEPITAQALYHVPMTAHELESDPLSAVLSILGRWSRVTTPAPPK